MKILLTILRVICYLALVVMLLGAAGLFLPFMLDLCSNQSGGTVKCTEPLYRQAFEIGFTIVMMGVYTGAPLILALGGAIFGLFDISRYLRQG